MASKSTQSPNSPVPSYLKTTSHKVRGTTVSPPGKVDIQGRKLQMLPISTKQMLKEQILLSSTTNPKGTGMSTTYNTYKITTKASTASTSITTLQLTSVPLAKAPGNAGVSGCSPDGVVVSDIEGVIESPNFGFGNYPSETKCVWKIKAATGEVSLSLSDYPQ